MIWTGARLRDTLNVHAGGAARPSPAPVTEAGVEAAATWKEADRLVSEQKFQEALSIVERIRRAAQEAQDQDEWTRALIREVQLRSGLHEYETSVRFLKEQRWPEGQYAHATLNLFYAELLLNYYRGYAWEVNQREAVVSQTAVDLKAWTRGQILAEAEKAHREVWQRRADLGNTPVTRLAEYVQPNDYPPEIRASLRDAVSYLYAALLSQRDLWSSEQQDEIYRLDLAGLLAEPAGQAVDPAEHPLLRACTVLEDLEAWHIASGRREAALEARLERLRRLHEAFTQEEDRSRITRALTSILPAFRPLPWWAMGQELLAGFVREESSPDALVRARAEAEKGWRAFPDSVGGRRCLSIMKSIEAPGYNIQSMSSDGPGRRSILVTARNLRKLYFRAYSVDLLDFIRSAKDYNILPAWQEIEKILRERPPVAEWPVDLPDTPDYRDHKTFVTPPMTAPGAYVIAASARPAFGPERNHIGALNFIVSDLVLMVRHETDGGCEVRTLSGRDGSPVSGAEVRLYRYDWQSAHAVDETKTSNAGGSAMFAPRNNNDGNPRFLLARSGANLAIDPDYLFLFRQGLSPDVSGALVYTDRSVYRPLQKLFWKVVIYKGSTDSGRYRTVPAHAVNVVLLDANNQEVESKQVTTNAAGSISGEFVVPSGRLLGRWYVRTSAGGQSAISVEEYKRPTFEVTLRDPQEPLRLNRPATLTGEAKYYFGLPVVTGDVRWRVMREAVYPWWWSWYWGADRTPPRTIGAGTSSLRPDGTFTLTFTPAADEREAIRSKEITYRYSLTADVTDEGGETRTGTRSFTLGFVSVRAQIDSDASFFRAGANGMLRILRTDLNGTPRPGNGAWRITALRQPDASLLPSEQPQPKKDGEYLTPGDGLRPRWDPAYSPEAVMRSWADGEVVARGELTHKQDGSAAVALPDLHAGPYRLKYETTDDFGASSTAAKEFVIAGHDMRLALPGLLLAESSSVPTGGTARFLAHSGIPAQRMYVEIYRSGRLVERRTHVSGREPSLIEIPVGETDRGGFAVRMVLLNDHQLIDFSQSVFVPWDDKELKVEFATFRDKLRPGASETWRVTVKDHTGAPAGLEVAELLAYMYDRSLDIFALHSPPDPRSVYPTKTQAGWWKASLGVSSPVYTSGYALDEVPGYPSLTGDQLRFYGSYAIGGPGKRNGFAVEESQMARQVGAPASAAVVGGLAGGKDEEQRQSTAKSKSDAPSSPEPSASGTDRGSTPMRSEFAETAFWMPHLLTNADGSASFEFKVPDSVTSWNVWVHAVTQDLHGGSVHKETKSVKELMVRPYVPRFLREGDLAELKVVVNNASEASMNGRVTLDIVDPDTNRSLLRDFGFSSERAASKPFAVNAGGGANVVFTVAAPARVGPVAFKVVATAGDLSDGELRPVPILPGRMHLAQSRFVTLKGASRREMVFEDLRRGGDPTRIDEQMVVTVDAQLFYGVLSAMPYLVNYPYECTEQTLNRFLSTGILSSLYGQYPAVARMAKELSGRDTQFETWDSQDPNRKMGLEETPWVQEAQGGDLPSKDLIKVLDPRISRAQRDESLAKLRKAQTSLGAFPWWPGGPPSPYMTLYLLDGFSKGLEFGVEVPKETIVRAWAYMHRHYIDTVVQMMMGLDCCWEFVTYLNYVLSSYPDSSWTGGVFTDQDRSTMLDFSFRHWKDHAPYSKCQLALTLQRMKRARDAKLVFDSVMDSSHTTEDEGTFWAPEDRAWLWYNDTIETHAFALRTLMELNPKDARTDGLVQWLFLNKKLNHWKSTKATAEVSYSLVHYLKQTGALGARESATVEAGKQRVTWVFEPDRYTGKKNQLVIPGDKIDPESSSTVVVTKEGPGMAFASATWQFSTEKLPDEARGDFFSVTRQYFKRENTGKGFVLTPLAQGTPIRVGDEVEVQLSIRTKHAAEYVHLRDPRAAGYEPVSLHSGYRWDLGVVTYEEVRDSGENFFFENLPAGEYTFKYRIRATMAGTFKVAPATIQSMYAPEFNAYSSGVALVIRP
ncbi:MAG: hypothetical protein HYX75_17870 [Acidobacteria bacterium]|nr:hypothetical protein [Acidobacteriota bacterium]